MTRNDVHAPTNLKPEDYDYVASMDLQEKPPMVAVSPAPGVVYFQPDPVLTAAWLETRKKLFALFADSPEHVHDTGQCDHCGAHLRYLAIMRYRPTGHCLTVGETCLENRFSLANDDFQRMRKQAELDREKHRIIEARREFSEQNPDLAFLAFGDLPKELAWNNYIADLAHKLKLYGTLSERQIEAARRTIEKIPAANQKHQEHVERKAQEEAEKQPVVEGRIEVTGKVLTVREPGEYDQFPQWKMLVEDDRHFKVWGSIPASLIREIQDRQHDSWLSPKVLKDQRVQFVATVEASKPRTDVDPDAVADKSFGFFSRPSKARLV